MKKFIVAVVLLAVLVPAAVLAGCGGTKVPAGAIAAVGSGVVTQEQFDGIWKQAEAQYKNTAGAPAFPKEGTAAYDQLKAAELPATAGAVRGGRLQLDGLDLDDDWAARLRASNDRVVYMKQKRSLSAHREAIGDGLLGCVETTLDAIMDARVSRDRSSTPGRESL